VNTSNMGMFAIAAAIAFVGALWVGVPPAGLAPVLILLACPEEARASTAKRISRMTSTCGTERDQPCLTPPTGCGRFAHANPLLSVVAQAQCLVHRREPCTGPLAGREGRLPSNIR
jgi:hypothetical protein